MSKYNFFKQILKDNYKGKIIEDNKNIKYLRGKSLTLSSKKVSFDFLS